jgi:DNA-directed RNA polymerase sigma subunit (sigma70/sigma32)
MVKGKHERTIASSEYAWLLRAEGLTLLEIGKRLDLSIDRIRQMLDWYSRRMQRAVRRTSFRIEERRDGGSISDPAQSARQRCL